VANQTLLATEESNAASSRDLQTVQASTASLKDDLKATRSSATTAQQELSSKLAAFDELVVGECDAQDKLQALGEEKKTQEHLLESTQKMLSERDYASSIVISSAVAHTMALLKSYVPDHDTKLLRRDYPFNDDDERDALIDSMYDTTRHFVSIRLFCSQ
jgi:chromosome segregation ATPase